MTRRTRLILAAALAPIAGVLMLGIVLAGMSPVLLPDVPSGEASKGGLHASFFLVFFGTPMAYGIALVVGVPAFSILKRIGWLLAGPVIAIATAAGAISMPFIWNAFWGVGGVDWLMVLIGAGIGSMAGTVFWIIGLRGSNLVSKSNGLEAR